MFEPQPYWTCFQQRELVIGFAKCQRISEERNEVSESLDVQSKDKLTDGKGFTCTPWQACIQAF